MHVEALAEGVLQRSFTRAVSENAQLHLRIVKAHEVGTRTRHKGITDLPSRLGADGDVLQVRVCGRQPAGLGHRLVEGGVKTPINGIDQVWERRQVGAVQLHQFAVAADEGHDLVLIFERAQDLSIG